MTDKGSGYQGPSWRSTGAVLFFFSALIGFQSGVSVSERPEILERKNPEVYAVLKEYFKPDATPAP